MKTNLILGAALLFTASLYAAEGPAADVTAAAKKLADQSYSWTATVTVPESARWKPGPTEGKAEKGGVTHVTMSFGENKTEIALKGDKAAVKGQDGNWQSTAELENAEGPGRFGAMFARNFKAPAEQAVEMAGYLKDAKKEGEAISAALTEEGAKTMLRWRGRGGNQAPEITGASGTAKFWIKDGVLSKFQYDLKGKMKMNDNDVDMDRSTVVEIKDIGKTKVTVPEEASKKLS